MNVRLATIGFYTLWIYGSLDLCTYDGGSSFSGIKWNSPNHQEGSTKCVLGICQEELIHYITDCSKTGEFHFEGPDAERAGYAGLVPLKSVFFCLCIPHAIRETIHTPNCRRQYWILSGTGSICHNHNLYETRGLHIIGSGSIQYEQLNTLQNLRHPKARSSVYLLSMGTFVLTVNRYNIYI